MEMSHLAAYEYTGSSYPRGLAGEIVIDKDDIEKYVEEWNEYVTEHKSWKMSVFTPLDNVQDHIFNQFINEYGDGVFENQSWGGGASYKSHSYLTHRTFIRRLNECRRGKKPFKCHFFVKFNHMNEWCTYYTVDIVK